MTRNEANLKFQMRLIQTALQSPKADAMRLLGIVASNMEEFITVRLSKVEKNVEDIMDRVVEVYTAMDAAIERKFPNLYDENSWASILDRRHYLDESCDFAIFAYKCGDVFNKNGQFVCGAIREAAFRWACGTGDSAYYTHPEVHIDNRDEREGRIYTMFGSNFSLPTPIVNDSLYRSTADLIEASLKLTRENATHAVSLIFDEPQSNESHRTVTYYGEIEDTYLGRPITHHVIYCTNALLLNFASVAKKILSKGKEKGLDDQVLYASIGPNVKTPFSFQRDYDSEVLNMGMRAQVFRGPFGEQHPMYDTLNNLLEQDLESAWMTIYRTDKVDSDGPNVKFIRAIAKKLDQNAHIYIEARARGDEKNNIALYRELSAYGADVRIVPTFLKYRGMKIHAKVWYFKPVHGGATAVLSTGNFSQMAQSQFSDTVILLTNMHEYVNLNTEIQGMFNHVFNVLDTKTVATVLTEKQEKVSHGASLIWKPKAIRKQLLSDIESLRILAMVRDDPQNLFIKMKVNHITDKKVIRALQDAADAGITVTLIVRTTCMIPIRLNSKIKIYSAVGNVLEHDRMYIFGDKTDSIATKVYISSADLMERNLDGRIEFLYRMPKACVPAMTDLIDNMIGMTSSPSIGFFNYRLN